jgi:hypothetical protein
MMTSGSAAVELTELEPIDNPDHNHQKPRLETFAAAF